MTNEPRSVALARRWVTDVCKELEREDLVDTAQLAVSELVTNALLHAQAPIAVRVRGTAEHVRVEISDGSTTPPKFVEPEPDEDDSQLTTFGRGLGIVAMCSQRWGAVIEPHGKTVWFEPRAEPDMESTPKPDLILPDDTVDTEKDRSGWVEVVFDNIPIDLLASTRQHFNELRRELRLLALSHQDDYPLAGELSAVFRAFDNAVDPTQAAQADRLMRSGATLGHMRARFDPECIALAARMLDMFDLADEFCRAHRLLSLARTPDVRAFQTWWFGEYIRQCRGLPPTTCPRELTADAEPAL